MAGVDAIVHLAAIPRDFDGGQSLRLVNTEGTRNVVHAARDAGVRRFVHQGALAVVDDPELALRELEGEGDGDRPRQRARLDGPRPVAAVRAARRVLQPDRRARPDLARRGPDHRHGRGAVPAAGDRRPDRRGRGRRARGRHHRRARVPARRAALLDLPGDRRGGPSGHGEAAGPRPDAGPGDPPRRGLGRVRPPPVPGRHRPAAPAQVRQHRPPRLGPVRLRVRAAADGGRSRPRREVAGRAGAAAEPREPAEADRAT